MGRHLAAVKGHAQTLTCPERSTTMRSPACHRVLGVALLFVGEAVAQGCTIDGRDYSALANSVTDYTAQSTSYQNYEFVFNVCRQLVWSEGECMEGSSVCERLKTTQTATDVYGKYASQTTGTDATNGPYTEMDGDACLFGSGQNMQSRIYFKCGDTESSEVIFESYYDCQVHVMVTSPKACGGGGPSAATAEAEDVGMILCVVGFLGVWMYFAIGAAFLYRKGERGFEMVVHKEWWKTIPSLIWDGMQFSSAKAKETYAKFKGGGGEADYSELK